MGDRTELRRECQASKGLCFGSSSSMLERENVTRLLETFPEGRREVSRVGITMHIGIVHSDIQEVCRSSRMVTALVLKFITWGACSGAQLY